MEKEDRNPDNDFFDCSAPTPYNKFSDRHFLTKQTYEKVLEALENLSNGKDVDLFPNDIPNSKLPRTIYDDMRLLDIVSTVPQLNKNALEIVINLLSYINICATIKYESRVDINNQVVAASKEYRKQASIERRAIKVKETDGAITKLRTLISDVSTGRKPDHRAAKAWHDVTFFQSHKFVKDNARAAVPSYFITAMNEAHKIDPNFSLDVWKDIPALDTKFDTLKNHGRPNFTQADLVIISQLAYNAEKTVETHLSKRNSDEPWRNQVERIILKWIEEHLPGLDEKKTSELSVSLLKHAEEYRARFYQEVATP
ncbi:MAG: hypothetical protein AAF720_15365 [Pseudomonadota bacterium]